MAEAAPPAAHPRQARLDLRRGRYVHDRRGANQRGRLNGESECDHFYVVFFRYYLFKLHC